MSRLLDSQFYVRNRGALGGLAFGVFITAVGGLLTSVLFTGEGLSDTNTTPEQVYFIEE